MAMVGVMGGAGCVLGVVGLSKSWHERAKGSWCDVGDGMISGDACAVLHARAGAPAGTRHGVEVISKRDGRR